MPSILTYNIKILFNGDKNRYSLKIYMYIDLQCYSVDATC